MRLTRTSVLQLNPDPAAQQRMCGDLLAPPGRRTRQFRDGTEPLGLLRRLPLDEAGEGANRKAAPQASDPDPPERGPNES
jgi:hypothetical protein